MLLPKHFFPEGEPGFAAGAGKHEKIALVHGRTRTIESIKREEHPEDATGRRRRMVDLRNFKGTVMEVLGIECREASKEKVVLTMPVTPKTHQPMGALHGVFRLSLPRRLRPWAPG